MKEDSGNLDIRELNILEKIENNGHLTQRELSREVGIALELVNLLLKKMVKKGGIKINNIDAKRVIKDKIMRLKNEDVTNVSIYGINHISEVLFIVLKELSLGLICVV